MTWWAYAILGLSIFAVGFLVGRSSYRPPPTTVETKAPDAGTTSVATAAAGPVSCDAGVVVVVKPGRPYPVYLPGDAGVVLCPVCPSLEVTANANSLAGPATAQANAASPPPVVVTRVEYRETHRVFGLGPAFTKPYEVGGLGFGATVQWQPFNWFEVSGTFTTKEVMVSPTVRF